MRPGLFSDRVGGGVRVSPRQHAVALVLILLLGPTPWRLGDSLYHFPPDTGLYLSLAHEMAADGRLALEDWGHPGAGVILPPLYPAAIAAIAPLAGDHRAAAEVVSWAAAVAALVPLYLLGVRIAGAPGAVAAVVAAQWNLEVARIALTPLTESLFVCTTAFALLALRRHARGTGVAATGLLAGVLLGAVFLTRQIGLVLLVFAALWLLLPTHAPLVRRSPYLLRLASLLLGVALVVAPYGVALYRQTASTPLHQHFTRPGAAPQVDAATRTRAAELHALPEGDYASLYAKRRALRALTPDASAMYAAVEVREEAGDDVLSRVLARAAADPGAVPRALARNASHLVDALGPAASALFALALLTLFWAPRDEPCRRAERVFLALFALAYLLALSLATGDVARYVHVLIPFALLHVATEAAVIGRALLPGRRLGGDGLPVLFALACMLTAPGRASQLEPRPRLPVARLSIGALAHEVTPGEPVLALHPMLAYYLGGSFRMLPNDRLDRIVDYARATGVRWLLVSRTAANLQEMDVHYDARWYLDPVAAARPLAGVSVCCAAREGELVLLRIDPLG